MSRPMAKPMRVKTTESSKKHTFSSFRERVDSIKIEPSLKLTKRAYDDADSSHFISTLDHWREVNLSGNFTELVEKIDNYSQSLPQIIYHQQIIFDSLYDSIQKNDIHSIQPLLELLSQFIHDLGPDFMPFYERFLNLLTEIALNTDPNEAQNSRNSSNSLEWIFNCLTFAFKYLSRSLVDDLKPTFQVLLPILKLEKKTYISRFCAEALSFLVRKSKMEAFTDILQFTFNEQSSTILDNESYCDSLTTLFSESMKNTKGTFHSKSSSILSKIVENALNNPDLEIQAKYISIVSDILLEVINHGSPEACEKFYELVAQFLESVLIETDSLDAVLSVVSLTTILTFAESGKKVKDWNIIIKVITSLIDKLNTKLIIDDSDRSIVLMEGIVYLFTILFRNASILSLTKSHKTILDFISTIGKGHYFLLFSQTSLSVNEERMINFGITNAIQDFINKIDFNDIILLQKLSLFLTYLKSNRNGNMASNINIPFALKEYIMKDLSEFSSNPQELYWRLLILRHNGNNKGSDSKVLINLITDLLAEHQDNSFAHDIIAITCDAICEMLDSEDITVQKDIFNLFVQHFERLSESSAFIASFDKFLSTFSINISESLKSNYTFLVSKTADNVCLPSSVSRLAANGLISTIQSIAEKEEVKFLSQMKLIDQIPLTISTARDISLRIRNLSKEFKGYSDPSEFDRKLITNFYFGLLSNRFQPCWQAVYESLPELGESCSKNIWELSYKLITLDYKQSFIYYSSIEEDFGIDSDLINWQPHNSRLKDNFITFENRYFDKFRNTKRSILTYAEDSREKNIYSSLMRSQVLEGLSHIAYIAEQHSEPLIKLLLNNQAEDGESGSTSEVSWPLKDRNELVKLFTKFKRLRKVNNSSQIYDHFMKLLANKSPPVQKLALEALFSWGIPTVNKYRDNLRNLLDDSIFKDELANFIKNDGSDSSIEEADIEKLMPFVLRILFGRVQGSPRSNSKAGKKFAVISVLPNFSNEWIIEFIKLGADKIGYESYFTDETLPEFNSANIRRISGFINLLTEIYGTLGSQYNEALKFSVEPLVFSLVVAQKTIDIEKDSAKDTDTDTETETDIQIESVEVNVNDDKAARNIRQMGMRCLNDLFKLVGERYDWNEQMPIIYNNLIKPRLSHFAQENLQQVSSLMKIIVNWIDNENSIPFLYLDNLAPVNAITSLFGSKKAKEVVISEVLEFSIKALKRKVTNDNYFTLLALIVDALLKHLPIMIDNVSDRETTSKVVNILLLLIDGGYIDESNTKAQLIKSLTKALEKPQAQITTEDRASIIIAISSLLNDYDCTFEDIQDLYTSCSKLFRLHPERKIRETLVGVFKSIAIKFDEYEVVASLLEGLNSYSQKRMQELDFEKRIDSFNKINEEYYKNLTPTQWVPLISCALFFINDASELVIRTNAAYLLRRFIDCYSALDEQENAMPYISMLKNFILPHIRIGLRKENEDLQTEYISVLEHIVVHSQYFDELQDMKILTFHNDDESNFFKNVNHIQLHRRQRAIKRLQEYGHELNASSISHYILPIIERYAFSEDEKFKNIAIETIETINYLIRSVTWNHYKAVFKRYISNLKNSKQSQIKTHVNMIVSVSKGFLASIKAKEDPDKIVRNLPGSQLDIDDFILKEIFPSIIKILVIRNDETIVARSPLAEALASLIVCVSENLIESELPGILTSTCQVMRSRSEELRDAVRKTLGNILNLLGPKYLRFILKELKTALSRGSQIHVLSYTVHYLLVSISNSLSHGDLDDSVDLIVEVIMEDIFGAAGQEKDAEGYTSKMKEVKFKKSFDSGEIISSNIHITLFGELINPIKLLLRENISLKTQNKLDELLRRFALGLNHNDEASSKDVLVLCYEIYKQSIPLDSSKQEVKRSASENHFLVNLNAKTNKSHLNSQQLTNTLQKLSFELLSTVILRTESLLVPNLLVGFIPLLDEGLKSDNESVVIACLKALNIIIRLEFSDEENAIFKSAIRKSLTIIKDTPSTNSEISQASLKFLATALRNKSDVGLKDSAFSYVLSRILPDLEEPNRQGLAFNFVRAIVSQHIMLPEVYDTMDKISKIMVVNHSKEIRDMSRRIYFQFLMEYDQGRGKLEKQFKFLVNNLGYATEAGRSSVMELIHLIVSKAGLELLQKISSSFFVALSNVIVSDESPRCREMANALISTIISKLGEENLSGIEKYCSGWMVQSNNMLLKRCGLIIYKLYINAIGFSTNVSLDKVALDNVYKIIEMSSGENDTQIEWELVYSSLSVFSAICGKLKDDVFGKEYENIWKSIVNVLLFPHAWVRLISTRLIGILLTGVDKLSFDLSSYTIQTIAYRLLRQIVAPTITEDLGSQIIKNLVVIALKWENDKTKYEIKEDNDDEKFDSANDFLLSRICFTLRQERTSSVAKKCGIKFLAMFAQIISEERLLKTSEEILLSLYNFTEINSSEGSDEEEISNLTLECMNLIEEKLGVSAYTKIYSQVKSKVNIRRQERKTKRAQLAVSAPDVAAKRKLRKHERTREKRKHEKDENGYYRSKKKRFT
ncbi:armadillo-type protein [Scheffersomyces amazonensis]|uniref:armadillo-type protein n=1 Tax=Scheffersomyces amazonensis TaxID=1078765 RepID=UPI00315DBD80